jgi:phosphate transport system substrate-binding protein
MNRRNNIIGVVIAAVMMVLLASCSSGENAEPTATAPPPTAPAADVEVTLTILAPSGMAELLITLQPGFEAATPGTRLRILSGGANNATLVQAVQEGSVDAIFMTRAPQADEDVEYAELALVSQVIFTHPDVGFTNLTTEQAAAIFSGEITNWADVGGSDLEIVLCVRTEDTEDAGTEILREVIFGDTPFAETAQVMATQEDMFVAVAGIPGAVGYGSWSDAVSAGVVLHATTLDGLPYSNPDYPVMLSTGTAYLPERQADVQPFVDFLFALLTSEEMDPVLLQTMGIFIAQ